MCGRYASSRDPDGWLGGRRVDGAEYILDLRGFDDAIKTCDAVVTGEGRMDAHTLNGKLPAIVSRNSKPRPVHAVVGQSELIAEDQRRLGLPSIHALSIMTAAGPRTNPSLSKALATCAGQSNGRQLAACRHGANHRGSCLVPPWQRRR